MSLGDWESAGDLLAGEDLSYAGARDGTSAIRHDAVDLDDWRSASAAVPGMVELLTTARQAGPSGEALVRDVWLTLYKQTVTVKPNVPLLRSHAINAQMCEHLIEAAAWKDCRGTGTVGSKVAASIATKVLMPRLLDLLRDRSRDAGIATREEEMAIESLLERADMWEDIAARSPDKAKGLYDEAERIRAAAKERYGQLMPVLLDEDGQQILDHEGRHGLMAAGDQVDEHGKALEIYTAHEVGGAGSAPGQVSRSMTMDRELALAARIGKTPRAQAVAELTGKLTRIALHKQAMKIERDPDEITGVRVGRDLSRTLGSERILAGDPVGSALFGLRFVSGELMEYEVHAFEKQGRGKGIVVRDQSGSMLATYGEHKGADWCDAVTLAIAAIMKLQGRDLAVVDFSGENNIRTEIYPKGHMTAEQALDLVDRFYNGGTVYNEWMTECIRLVDTDEFNGADVILVSDGLCYVDPAIAVRWNEMRATRGMKLIALLVGPDKTTAYGQVDMAYAESVLGGLADAIVRVQDLADDDAATEAAFTI